MSELKIREIEMPVHMYSIKCPYWMTADRVVIHNTANDASAENEIEYMQSNYNQVSYHYAVDDKEAVLGSPLNRNTWHAGDGAYGDGNRKGIAIEICYSKSGGKRYDKAVDNALELTAQLMKQYNIPATNIMYHATWSGKHCPHRLLDSGVTLEVFRAKAKAKYSELYEGKAQKPQYQVVVGSFLHKENANKRIKELKAKGFDSFIQIKN